MAHKGSGVPSVTGGSPAPEKRRSRAEWFAPAIAATISGVLGLFAGAFGGRAVGVPGPAATVTTTVTATVTSSSNAAGGGGSSSPAKSTVYWSGPVAFSLSNNGLDFDTKPPSTDQTTILYNGNLVATATNELLAVWNQSGVPNASQCQVWVTTHPSSNVDAPSAGTQICIKTNQGRYGLLLVDSSNNEQLSATATIWNF
jgi:hypothetical protein